MTARLACLFAAAVGFAHAQPGDLRGVWKAEGKAYLNLETPGVIFEPASGKIPYRPEAQAQAAANFAQRASSGSRLALFPARRPARHGTAVSISDSAKRPGGVHRL